MEDLVGSEIDRKLIQLCFLLLVKSSRAIFL